MIAIINAFILCLLWRRLLRLLPVHVHDLLALLLDLAPPVGRYGDLGMFLLLDIFFVNRGRRLLGDFFNLMLWRLTLMHALL